VEALLRGPAYNVLVTGVPAVGTTPAFCQTNQPPKAAEEPVAKGLFGKIINSTLPLVPVVTGI